MSDATAELAQFFQESNLTAETVEQYAEEVFSSARDRDRFDSLVKEQLESGGAKPAALGIALHLLGRHADALEQLEKADKDPTGAFYAGESAVALGRWDEAVEYFSKAASAGWDALDAEMHIADTHMHARALDAAEKLIRKHEKTGPEHAIWHYAAGRLHEERNERQAALAAYDKALTLEPEHRETLFRAAALHDRMGDDERALQLYKDLSEQPRAHVNALINASVIYEDTGRYDEATKCLRRVLAAFPNHARARLFLKDVESSKEMIIDDNRERRAETRSRLLETPISEFELSVRARNCLKKMRITTLGDLLKLTEAELLAYKNFGETSLNEIKTLLAKRGLRLGQRPEEIEVSAAPEETEQPTRQAHVPPGSEALLAKPVSELELSVRARRCLQRLNIQTLGDLIQHSEQELLSTRNFGVTSLNEIKSRLGDFNLQLIANK